MDWITFSIGLISGLISGICVGIYIIITRIRKSFDGAQGIYQYFKDTLIEKDPSLVQAEEDFQKALEDRAKVNE